MAGGISETELAVMRSLWEGGPATVRDCQGRLEAAGRTWAYTTVQTLLGRLEGKGAVAVDRSAAAHVYSASKSRDDLLKTALSDLADELCDGRASPMVLALVEGNKLSPDEIDGFRRLLDKLERDGG